MEACGRSNRHSEEKWLILPGRGAITEDFPKKLRGKDSAFRLSLIPSRGNREPLEVQGAFRKQGIHGGSV